MTATGELRPCTGYLMGHAIPEKLYRQEAITGQSTENMEYVRRLLGQKQPGFSAALELAVMLAELELCPRQMPR